MIRHQIAYELGQPSGGHQSLPRKGQIVHNHRGAVADHPSHRLHVRRDAIKLRGIDSARRQNPSQQNPRVRCQVVDDLRHRRAFRSRPDQVRVHHHIRRQIPAPFRSLNSGGPAGDDAHDDSRAGQAPLLAQVGAAKDQIPDGIFEPMFISGEQAADITNQTVQEILEHLEEELFSRVVDENVIHRAGHARATRLLNRLTFGGAVYLATICVIPSVIGGVLGRAQ